MLHDIDTFISGINDYLALNSPSTAPWTRNDVYAAQRRSRASSWARAAATRRAGRSSWAA